MINAKSKKEKRKEYDRKYHQKWRAENPDKVKQYDNQINFGGKREKVLERDNWECVRCGMSNEQHILIFNKQITVDHIDGNRNNNRLSNLQTMCLRCHGKKDGDRRRTIRNQYMSIGKPNLK